MLILDAAQDPGRNRRESFVARLTLPRLYGRALGCQRLSGSGTCRVCCGYGFTVKFGIFFGVGRLCFVTFLFTNSLDFSECDD